MTKKEKIVTKSYNELANFKLSQLKNKPSVEEQLIKSLNED